MKATLQHSYWPNTAQKKRFSFGYAPCRQRTQELGARQIAVHENACRSSLLAFISAHHPPGSSCKYALLSPVATASFVTPLRYLNTLWVKGLESLHQSEFGSPRLVLGSFICSISLRESSNEAKHHRPRVCTGQPSDLAGSILTQWMRFVHFEIEGAERLGWYERADLGPLLGLACRMSPLGRISP